MRAALALLLGLLLGGGLGCGGAHVPGQGVAAGRAGGGAHFDWEEWSPEAFARARGERRLILLSVQAGWCHWCHVMNEVTYGDPTVASLLSERFVAIRADGDARPDLAERYHNYRWPATVLLTPDAREIVALRGHQPPARFLPILRRAVADLDAGRDPAGARAELEAQARGGDASLAEVRARVERQLDAFSDEGATGWGHGGQRYPFPDPVEHAFFRAAIRGEGAWRGRALATLRSHLELLDPVDGGMFQYSERGVWTAPHYEKIASIQAGAIHNFAEAYRATGDPGWLRSAREVARYVTGPMRAPDGAFYASQDADVGREGEPGHLLGAAYYALSAEERRARRAPAIDTRVYAGSNGELIAALADLAVAAGDPALLERAEQAARRVLSTHAAPGGGLFHLAPEAPSAAAAQAEENSAEENSVLYLADQAWMLRAALELYRASADPAWLAQARALADTVLRRFAAEGGGFYAHTARPGAVGVFAERRVPLLENAELSRGLIALSRLLHEERYAEAARGALAAIARGDEVRRLGRKVGPYLLALEAYLNDYVLFSVVGPAERPETEALRRAALAFYEPTALVERHPPGEGRYPYPGEPSVFLCSANACSMPITDPSELAEQVRTLLSRPPSGG